MRVSNVFEDSLNIRPLRFTLVDTTLKTSYAYRKAYPGRSVIEMDNVRSTTFPALPVDIDGAYLANIIDGHGKNKNGPLFIDPTYNDSNGTLRINTTLLEYNRIHSKPLVSKNGMSYSYSAVTKFKNRI